MSMPVRSKAKPDQSPQKCTFKNAVGRKEAASANVIITIATGLPPGLHVHLLKKLILGSLKPRKRNPSGPKATNQESNNGILLAFAPVRSAAASSEYAKSEPRSELQARQAKSTAARA